MLQPVPMHALVCTSCRYKQPAAIRGAAPCNTAVHYRGHMAPSLIWRHCPQHGHSSKHDGAYVVFKYYVPPSKADDFVDNWRKVEDGVRDEKHNIGFNLHKTKDDNVVFIGYGKWKDEGAFKDHLSQGYVRDFFDYLLDEDIPLRWQPLFKLTGDVHKDRREGEAGAT
jgi:quinol monooxygenase YgiN